MTDDQVALNDWYPVADAVPAPARVTRLLGDPLRIAFAGERPVVTAVAPDGSELRGLPVAERFGLVWTTLGSPVKDVYDFPEAHEPDRRHVRCGWVTLRTSAPRIVENFFDMAHFPYVHPEVLGAEPWTEVADYEAQIRPGADEVWATNCRFFQPRVAATESEGALAALTYRVPSPFQVMLYRVCPTAVTRLDAILLAVHPVDEHLTRAQPVQYLVDDHSADADLIAFEQAIFLQDRFIVENQRPLSLPLRPGLEIPVKADSASMTYRRWLRDKGLTFGVLA